MTSLEFKGEEEKYKREETQGADFATAREGERAFAPHLKEQN